ncbi:hypothetical protein FA13DRAFT_1719138 [Coprinellus micaceus]|uniref:Uncharacterized protein n=1 Tax=Coprinellus micaceus TaxID=71717 RepID=A0A4Y7SBV6_COPMI|nr:hypothetical protein FA13DRAFT_1719138 [Coprinellus micaceus]
MRAGTGDSDSDAVSELLLNGSALLSSPHKSPPTNTKAVLTVFPLVWTYLQAWIATPTADPGLGGQTLRIPLAPVTRRHLLRSRMELVLLSTSVMVLRSFWFDRYQAPKSNLWEDVQEGDDPMRLNRQPEKAFYQLRAGLSEPSPSYPHSTPTHPMPTSPRRLSQPLRGARTNLHPRLPKSGARRPPLRTYFDRRWNSFFPRDVLLEIFQYLRETSALRQAALWSEDELGEMRVGPPVAEVAHVCRFWRQVALSSPSLWDGIPIALESGRILSLANPGQIEFYRDMSSQAPLRLAIGTRSQLSGRGVHIQETPFPYPINILCDIAPRITELTISFDYRSMLLADLVDLSLSFDKLERLTLIGAAQSPYLLERAGFWKSPCMKSVAAAISESSFSFRLFGEIPWAGLREVLIGDEWDCALSSAQVHTFLARAANITKFQCRLRDAKVVGEDTEKRLSLPTLYHHDLRELTLTFHDYYASPALLSSLVCPNLERFSFKMDWSANFNPSSVPRWLCTASHSRLTRFECLASVDLDALIESVVSMPLLQVLKCHGPVASSYLSLAACPLKSVIDDRLLHALSGCLSGSDTSGPHCVQLRELWIKNAYFSNQGIGTFLEGRLSGKEPRVMLEKHALTAKYKEMYHSFNGSRLKISL